MTSSNTLKPIQAAKTLPPDAKELLLRFIKSVAAADAERDHVARQRSESR